MQGLIVIAFWWALLIETGVNTNPDNTFEQYWRHRKGVWTFVLHTGLVKWLKLLVSQP